jgi:hypothetical protein
LAKKPFSLAIIRGAASVRGINPSFALVVSTFGAFADEVTLLAGLAVPVVPPEELSAFVPFEEQPCAIRVLAAVIPAEMMNFLLERLVILDFRFWILDFGFRILECRDTIYRVCKSFRILDGLGNYELTNTLGFAPKCSISKSRKTGCKSSQGTPLVTQVPKLASLPTLPPM